MSSATALFIIALLAARQRRRQRAARPYDLPVTRRRALAADRGWPVSATDLQRCLSTASDVVKVSWVTWDQRTLKDPLTVSWHPSSDGIGSAPQPEGLTVWVRPVAKSELELSRRLISEVVLPDLSTWVAKALGSSPTWRLARHERRWSLNSTIVSTHDDHGMHILDRERS